MKISQLGEFNLIDRLAEVAKSSYAPTAPAWQNLILGIGDDAAVWQSEGGEVLATTDCLIQGIHFDLETTSWHDLGWKAMAVNLSDIAAMGGRPRYALVTLGLPNDGKVEDIERLYCGLAEIARRYGVAIVGGDTSSAPIVFINVTVTGQAGQHLLLRSAAKPGELVAVTGSFGAAAGGWRIIREGRKAVKADAPLRDSFLKPYPRLETGELLVEKGVRCAVDVSDGLVADLGHICRQSGVGAVVETDRVPVHPALMSFSKDEALKLALIGGEDYELIFTASKRMIETIQATTKCPVTVIGRVTSENPGEVKLLTRNGEPVQLDRQGWQHFAPYEP